MCRSDTAVEPPFSARRRHLESALVICAARGAAQKVAELSFDERSG